MLSSADAASYTAYYESQGQSASQAADSIRTLEVSMTQQYHNLAAEFGPGGTYDPGGKYATNGGDPNANVYLPSTTGGTTGIYVTAVASNSAYVTGYDPNTYDPNFVYLLSNSEQAHLVSGIKIWTPQELLTSISAGLLKTVTSTQTVNEAPNISANHIYLTVGNNIGSLTAPIGFATPITTSNPLTTPEQVALGAAEATDVTFLASAPVTETVNFGPATDPNTLQSYPAITIVGSDTWNTSVFQPGTAVYVTGATFGQTANATTDNYFFVVDHVLGGTIYFKSGAAPGGGTYKAVASENYKTVQVAAAITDLSDTVTLTPGTSVTGAVNFGNVSNNGTITLAAGSSMAGFAIGEGLDRQRYVGDRRELFEQLAPRIIRSPRSPAPRSRSTGVRSFSPKTT